MIAAEHLLTLDVLPDSRLSVIATAKGAVWRCGMWWQPIFCGNCGREGGLVPELHTTFVTWFCDQCEHVAQGAAIDGIYTVTERQFWARVELEMRERYGRLLTEPEVAAIVEADASPLATLLKQGR